MAGVCNYQSKDPYYSGRDLDNYCSFTRNDDVEPFGTNRFIASWKLFSLTMRDTAQAINKAMRSCLDPHNNQALSLHDGGMEGVESPILKGSYDVTCGDTDPGLSGHNTEVTDTYTIEYDAHLQCNNSNPIAVINSMVKFHEEPGLDPNCLEANSTRFVEMDTSTTGTSGIIRAAVEKCIGLKNTLTDQLDALPERTTHYIEEYRCRFSTNQTFTPIPSPSSSPTPSPSPFSSFSPAPSPSPFPSSSPTPSPSPFPSSSPAPSPSPFPSSSPAPSPSPFPSFSPAPSPSPFSSPSPFPNSSPAPSPSPFSFFSPTPSPTPDDFHEGFFEQHKIMIFIIAAISVIAFLVLAVYCYKRRSQAQVFKGTGPAVAREQPDEELTNPVNELPEDKSLQDDEDDMVEIPLITETDPLVLNGATTTYNGRKKED